MKLLNKLKRNQHLSTEQFEFIKKYLTIYKTIYIGGGGGEIGKMLLQKKKIERFGAV
jgi:Flp pilus assembly CpaF family ATPase